MKKAMRLGMTALLVTGGVALGSFMGCSSDDDPAPIAEDTGSAEETSIVDTGTPDTGTVDTGSATDSTAADGETTPAAVPKVNLVHGAVDLGAIRLCVYGGASKFAALDKQLPESAAGLAFGQGGALPVPAAIAPALTLVDITVYAVPASGDITKKCSELITDTATPPAAPAGSFNLGTLVKGTFAAGRTSLVAILGCKAGEGTDAAAKAKCGAGYDNTSNLRLNVLTQDHPAVTGKMGAQFVHMSPYVQAAAPAGIYTAFTVPAAASGDAGTDGSSDAAEDAATDALLDVSVDTGTAPPTILDIGGPTSFPATNAAPITIVPASAAQIAGLFTDRASTRFQAYASTGTARGPALLGGGIPLATIEFATTGMATPFLADGKSFTFIALGDPTKSAATDPTGFRVIALAND